MAAGDEDEADGQAAELVGVLGVKLGRETSGNRGGRWMRSRTEREEAKVP